MIQLGEILIFIVTARKSLCAENDSEKSVFLAFVFHYMDDFLRQKNLE
jgi:hypothetical protein